MKKLIIALETNKSFFSAAKKDLKDVLAKGKRGSTIYRISFSSRKDFNRFTSNIHVLQAIIKNNPQSVNELANTLSVDRSGVVKILKFFEEFEIVTYEEIKIGKRIQKRPIVDFRKIEIDLAA